MRTRRVIVLHSRPSTDPNVMAGAGGTPAGSLSISTFDSGSQDLIALRKKANIKIEAPSFDVKLIEPLDLSHATAVAGAPPPISWGVTAVGASDSWDGSGVTVAILDTGIDRTHPAFAEIEKIDEEDFTGEGNGDWNGHGTHCAGTICGRDVNGTRIGIARGVKRLLVAKVLSKEGGGSSDAIVDAMQWALKKGAHIISMSLGMDFPGYQKALVNGGRPEEVATSMALEGYLQNVRLFDGLAKLIAAGEFMGRRAVVVAAAGNESRRDVSSSFTIAKAPPAAADGFLSVGAVQMTNNPDRPFKVAPFSNTKAAVAAPGVEIWSAWPGGGLRPLSGTSMATPHVAGVAALWAQKSMIENDGDVVIGDVIDNLRSSAKMTPGLTREDVGKGVVQAPA
jgi:subtilisin family serine protease